MMRRRLRLGCVPLAICGLCGCSSVHTVRAPVVAERTMALESGAELQILSEGVTGVRFGREMQGVSQSPRMLYFLSYRTETRLEDCDEIVREVTEMEERLLQRATDAKADELIVKAVANPSSFEYRAFRWLHDRNGWSKDGQCVAPPRDYPSRAEAAEQGAAPAESRKEDAQ